MAATIVIIKTTGAVGYETETEKATVGLKSVDDAVTSIADAPINIPVAGTNYSYESWLRFKCTVAPDTECTNFKIWDDGVSMDAGVDIKINNDQVNVYATPVNTLSAKGTRASLSSHGSGSKIDVRGSLVNTGDKSDFMVFQEEVDNAASPGNITQKDVNYSYDEN